MTEHLPAEWLSGYLDGEASVEEHRRVVAHLEACPPCRQTLQDLRRTVSYVQALEPVAAPATIRATVRSRLAHNHTSGGALARLWSLAGTFVRPPRRAVLAVATILLVGVFSLNLLQQLRPAGPEALRELPTPAFPAQEIGPAATSPFGGVQRVGAPESQLPVPAPAAPPRLIFDRQVIRSADLRVEVPSFDKAADALVEIAESAGGFVADSNVTQTEPPLGTFILRVPALRFAGVLDRVEALGKVAERRVSGQDVTEEFIDVQARVRNLQAHERQLLTFMERATRVSDLLAIEQELSRVRGEIEQLTGRLRFLANRVEMATVQVTVREKAKQGSSLFWDFTASLRRVEAAFLGTVRQLLAAGERLMVVASALVPLALLALVGWGLIRWFTLRRTSPV